MQDPILEAFQRVKNDIQMLQAKINILDARQKEVETLSQKKLVDMVTEQGRTIAVLKNQMSRQERMIETLKKKRLAL